LFTLYALFLQKRVLVALEEAGVFTSGGLVKDKVCEHTSNKMSQDFIAANTHKIVIRSKYSLSAYLCFETTSLSSILISGPSMQVLFSSTENGRSSFVRQLEPDWHIDTNQEIVSQLAVCYYIYLDFIWLVKFLLSYNTSYMSLFMVFLMIYYKSCCRGLSSISSTYRRIKRNELLLMCSVLHPWNSSLDPYENQNTPLITCYS
jgi:hypothetical protein